MTRIAKHSLKPALLAGALALFAASQALAGQRTVIEKNHVMRISLAAPAGSVIVGNPEIADVSIVDSRTVYILGKGFGNSGVTITGRDGKPLFDGEIVVTTAQKGAITVYKGLKPSLMTCSNVCIAEDPDQSNTGAGMGASAPAPLIPQGALAMPPAQ